MTTIETPGLDRPTHLGVAHYTDPDGGIHSAPIYEPGPATNGQRIQTEDIDPTWTLVSEELFPGVPDTPSASDSIAAAADTFAASDLAVARAAADDLAAAATKLREAGL